MALNDLGLDQQTADEALKLLAQQNASAVTPVAAAAVTSTANPADITQSFYTNKSTAGNYTNNRPTYAQSDAVKKAAEELAAKEGAKPGEYKSTYGNQIQDLLDKALNRAAFSYDFADDPMYAQYADKYTQQGKQAMKSAMGQAAALTGGYGNSYSQSAGQQTYQQYMGALNDATFTLRDQAYQQYQDDGNRMQTNLAMLQGQEAIDYGKYRDTVTDYQTELAYFRDKYQDMSDSEYNRYVNDVSAWEADRSFWYQKEQDDYAKALAAAAAASRRGGGGGSRSSSASSSVPTNYKDFVALTGQSGIMTRSEYEKRNPGSSYQGYLNTMWAKHN